VKRYGTAAELAEDLRRHLNELPLRGVPNRSLAERWRKWRRRSPHLLSRYLMAALIVSLSVFGFLVLLNWQHAGREQPSHTAATDDRAWARDHLHALAERLRRAALTDFRTARTDRDLAEQCKTVWERREQIRQQLGNAAELEADLLEVALLGNDLRLAAAPSGEVPAAHRQALQVVAEAEHFFGPSHLLLEIRWRLAQALGQKDVARETRQRAAAVPPASAWEHYRLGRGLLQEGDAARALPRLAHAVELEPGCFWFQFHHGVCQYRLGKITEALPAFSAAIVLCGGPDRARCYVDRGLAYARSGQTARAFADYDRALALDARLASAVFHRGVLHYQCGELAAALTDLRRALDLGAEAELTLFNLALVHEAQHERSTALRYLDQVLERNPAHQPSLALRKQLANR
jgi:tetratricopeptide (TPR) repeat protein